MRVTVTFCVVWPLAKEYHKPITKWIQNNRVMHDIHGTRVVFDRAHVKCGMHETINDYDRDRDPHATVKMTNKEIREQDTHYVLHWRPNRGSKYMPVRHDEYTQHAKEKKDRRDQLDVEGHQSGKSQQQKKKSQRMSKVDPDGFTIVKHTGGVHRRQNNPPDGPTVVSHNPWAPLASIQEEESAAIQPMPTSCCNCTCP